MNLLRLRQFLKDDLATYEAWFGDAELSRRAAYPDEEWMAELNHGDGVVAMVATLGPDSEIVAVLRYEAEENAGASMFFAVTPSRRRQGIGLQTLKAFSEHASDRFSHIDVYVEEDNAAALALVRKAGYRLIDVLDDAVMHYRATIRD